MDGADGWLEKLEAIVCSQGYNVRDETASAFAMWHIKRLFISTLRNITLSCEANSRTAKL